MELKSITIGPKAIILNVSANPEDDAVNDKVDSKITANEVPLPSFTKAFAALPAVFCAIMETGPEWTEGLAITKLTITRTKQGTRSVVLQASKQLDCRQSFLHTVDAPSVQIDKAADGESGAIQIDTKLAAKVAAAILQAEMYMEGKRSQQRLAFDADKDALNAQFRDKDAELRLA